MRFRTLTAATALALGATAGVAAAAVLVYENDFSSRADFKQIDKQEGGKDCKRFGRKQKAYGVEAKEGPVRCVYRTPVQGDAKEPDHEVEAKAKVLKKTAKGVRRDVYVAVGARSGESGYQFRVFPATEEWEVERKPDGEGFPVMGKERKINGIGEKNRLRLQVFGNKVTAAVNGEKVADEVADPRPGDLNGRKTTFALGHGKKTENEALALFDNVKVRVPNP